MREYKYSQQELSDKIFDFIYKVSMRDAVLRGAYEGDRKEIDDIEAPKKALQNYIDELLNNGFSGQDDHDRLFLNTAKEICQGINNSDKASGAFHFGNAQKLINIAVKHIYTFCYHDKALRENFKFCHCPMDSIMLKKVWDLYKVNHSNQERRKDLGDREEFLKSWGKEELQDNQLPNRYKTFQDAIHAIIDTGDMYPIEFDYKEWNSTDADNEDRKGK